MNLNPLFSNIKNYKILFMTYYLLLQIKYNVIADNYKLFVI